MRIAYLDEAGISNPVHEPYVVVAGIIVHADEQWYALEEHLRSLAARYLPNDPRPVFHAMEIFHGTKRFNRADWPKSRRWDLLLELCEIPKIFRLPVVIGWRQRAQYKARALQLHPQLKDEAINKMAHAEAFVDAAMCIEHWMRFATEDEAIMMIAEDTPKIKKGLKAIHAGYTDRFSEVGLKNNKMFDSRHIIDTVHFAAKTESMPLQIADACAFVTKRHFMQKEDAVTFFAPLRPEVIYYEHGRYWQAESA